MRIILITALAALAAGGAGAQVPPAEIGQRYIPAPWWLREPVVAVVGLVRTELPANRAAFSATFVEVDRDAAEATRTAALRVDGLDAALRALGRDRARLETTFMTRPLYSQYRDKDGNLQENRRADQIDRYEVTAQLSLQVRDLTVLEDSYNRVVAAKPTSVGPVRFTLEPDNETRTKLANEAVRDAVRRARAAADAAGVRLGAPKIIDPSGRVCETDVLAGWPSYSSSNDPTDVSADAVRSQAAAPPPPPPPPPPAAGQQPRVTLQPPLQKLSDSACIVFGLTP